MAKWRWQDYASVLIGVWLVAMPWVFEFVDSHPLATWNLALVGLAIALIAAVDMEVLSEVEEWVLVALGAWVAASPWVFGLSAMTAAVVGMVLAGLAVIALTLWEMATAGLLRRGREHAHG